MAEYEKEGLIKPPVLPDIRDWPITLALKNKKEFVEAVVNESMEVLERDAQEQGLTLHALLEKSLYQERRRILEEPWPVDPKDQKRFWKGMGARLMINAQVEDLEERHLKDRAMLEEIAGRYAEEIFSAFKPATYHFAKRALPFFFSTLLNASAGKAFRSLIRHRLDLQDKVHLLGEIDRIRSLAAKGTIVLVPTHFSNVDSILIGWALHALGLPAFIYGAGLNLFNSSILGYLMGRIGAYKVDRRKKNAIYHTVLRTYSTQALERGCHSLFFPGGTRSRSGAIEGRLKLGLLGTAVEVQRRRLEKGEKEKIFIVPMVMSYHFVLEAKSLINQHLKKAGQEHYYIKNDEFASHRKFLSFVWKAFSKSSNIVLNFGKPTDIFGNLVDDEGESYDAKGRKLDIKGYFMSGGEMTIDRQRDFEYTRLLGQQIVSRYHAENMVFSSHLVAFVGFELLKKKFPKFDLYELLRIPEEERVLPHYVYNAAVERVVAELQRLRAEGEVFLAPHMLDATTDGIIKHGLENLGLFHSQRPLKYLDEQTLASDNLNLLYFYHNRLNGYQLERFI